MLQASCALVVCCTNVSTESHTPVTMVHSASAFLLFQARVGRSEEGKWESKVGSESERINRQIGIELLGGTDPVVVTDPDPNRFGFG